MSDYDGQGFMVGLVIAGLVGSIIGSSCVSCIESKTRSPCEDRGSSWTCRAVHVPDSDGTTQRIESCVCVDGGGP